MPYRKWGRTQERNTKTTRKDIHILIPGCIPNPVFTPYSKREKTIVAFDRWVIGNVPNFMLAILGDLLDKGVMLKIAGFWHPYSLKDFFMRMVEELGLEKRVDILPALNEQELSTLCSGAMLYVHLINEAFGSSVLEAAANGCSIVIPKPSGVAELFEDGEHGFLKSRYADYHWDLVAFINELFADIGKAENKGFSAWQTAQKYTYERYIKNLDYIITRR